MGLVERFFAKSGITEEQLRNEAQKILSKTTEERRNAILELARDFSQRSLRMQPADKKNYSYERAILDEDMKQFNVDTLRFAMAESIAIDDMISWLRQHYAYFTYCKEFSLASEGERKLAGDFIPSKKSEH